MSKLYFCTDGVLRIRSRDEKHMFGIHFIQQQDKLSDFSFWVQWWHQPVIFEKGLTFANFFQCIEPWIDFWGECTQTDLRSYMVELRKPTLIEPGKDSLDWLCIDYKSELRPKCIYPDIENLTKVVADSNWQINSYYELNAYQIGKQQAIIVQWTPLNQLANLPLVLNQEEILMIDEYLIGKYDEKKNQIINPEGLGVTQVKNPVGDEYQFSYVTGTKIHELRNIIEGIFYGFDSSPEIRDKLDNEFQNTYHSNLDSIENAPEITDEEYENALMEDNELFEEPRLAKNLDSDDPYFQNLLRKAKKDINSKIRIGRIIEALPLENRICSLLKD